MFKWLHTRRWLFKRIEQLQASRQRAIVRSRAFQIRIGKLERVVDLLYVVVRQHDATDCVRKPAKEKSDA